MHSIPDISRATDSDTLQTVHKARLFHARCVVGFKEMLFYLTSIDLKKKKTQNMSSKLFVKNVFQERHCIDDINNFIFFLIDERVLQKNSSSKFKKKKPVVLRLWCNVFVLNAIKSFQTLALYA